MVVMMMMMKERGKGKAASTLDHREEVVDVGVKTQEQKKKK